MKPESANRSVQLLHQIVSLTGINFSTRSIIGYVELTLLPLRDNIRHVRVNAKQLRIYKVILNGSVEVPFQYCDPTLEVCPQEVAPKRDLETYAEAHLSGCNLVEPDLNGGELNIRIPSETKGHITVNEPFKLGIEFSLEEPHGGIHFVVPENPFKNCDSFHSQSPAAPAGETKAATPTATMAERGAHLFMCSHENSSRLWFPCIDSSSELCTWKLEFTVDESMTAVSCGELKETVYTPDMKRKTFHYQLDTPTSANSIALAVGPFEIYVDPNMHEVTHFCLPHLLPVLKATARWLHEAFEFFEMTLANRFPYTCYKHVYVDEAYCESANYATMSILSTTLLHSSAVIDQVYDTRTVTAHCLASQFYGTFITTERWSDVWLRKGLALYLTGLFVKKFFGNNEYRSRVHKQMEKIVKYEEKYGCIVLDSSQPPANVASSAGRGREVLREPQREETPQAFSSTNLSTCSPEYLEMMALKSHLCVRMLENRIGAEQLLQVLNKQLSLAMTASTTKNNPQAWSNMVISTQSFTKAIFTVTGKDMNVFMDQWIRTGGHARFHMKFVFNRKRNTVEMEINQDAYQQGVRGIRKYVGPLTVAVQELDGWFSYTYAIENVHSKHDITCHSKSRRNKKKKIPLCTNEEVDMDLSAMDDSPVLWIRLDPDMQLVRSLDIQQPDFQWQYQLRHERDVTAQIEAAQALERFPTAASRKALTDIIEDEKCFYRVRCLATHCLSRVANAMASNWEGPPAMMVIFKKMFGSFAASHIVKQNDFSNLQSYFLQKEIPIAMAKLRNAHGICPPEVLRFLLDLFKYNDNSKNNFSDNYYRAALVDALGETVTPVLSVVQNESGVVTAESLSPDTKLILEEITRFLNLEKLLPSYKYTVTLACLKAIRKLQKTGHLPSSSALFKDYAAYGQFVDVRIAALECLVDFVRAEGSFKDIAFALDLLENDPVPFVRHKLCRLLVENAPFDRARRHKNDRPELAERLWHAMNSSFWYDSRLRCDVVDIYFELYGMKRPVCLPSPEMAMFQPQKVEKPKAKPKAEKEKSFVIPRAEKRKAEAVIRPHEIPAEFADSFEPANRLKEKRQTLPADIPDYFADAGAVVLDEAVVASAPMETSVLVEPPAASASTSTAASFPKPSSSSAETHSHHRSSSSASHHKHKEKKRKKDKKKKHKKHKKHSSELGSETLEKKKHKSKKHHKSESSRRSQSPFSSVKALPDMSSLGDTKGLSSGSSTPSPGNSPGHL